MASSQHGFIPAALAMQAATGRLHLCFDGQWLVGGDGVGGCTYMQRECMSRNDCSRRWGCESCVWLVRTMGTSLSRRVGVGLQRLFTFVTVADDGDVLEGRDCCGAELLFAPTFFSSFINEGPCTKVAKCCVPVQRPIEECGRTGHSIVYHIFKWSLTPPWGGRG